MIEDLKGIVLTDPDAKASEWTQKDYVDYSALDAEKKMLSWGESRFYDVLSIVARSIISQRDVEGLNDAWFRFSKYINLGVKIQGAITGHFDDLNIIQADVMTCTRVGASVIAQRALEQIVGILERNNSEVGRNLADVCSINRFPFLMLNSGGVTLRDFRGSISDAKIIPCLNFVLTFLKLPYSEGHRSILDENKDNPLIEYPNCALEGLDELSHITTAFGNIDVALLAEYKSQFKKAGKAVDQQNCIQEAANLEEGFISLSRSLRRVLANPKSKQYCQVKEIIEANLKSNRVDQFMVLSALGVFPVDHDAVSIGRPNFFELYRRAKGNLSKGIDRDFYSLLCKRLEEFWMGVDTVHISSADDLETVYDSASKVKSNGAVGLRTVLSSLTSEIKKATSEKSFFNVSPDKVDWRGFAIPKEAVVILDKQKGRAGIYFHYNNEQGEFRQFRFIVDGKQKDIDWILLDSPDDPSVQPVVSDLLEITRQCLALMSETDPSQKSHIETQSKSPEIPKIQKREYDPTLSEKYKVAQEKAKPLSFFEQLIRNLGEEAASKGIKTTIGLPSDPEQLDRLFKNLEPTDIAEIKNKVEEHNMTGAGKIIPYETETKEGLTQYKFRVGNKRLVLIEDGTTDGEIKYRAIAAGLRKRIYRDIGI